MNHYGNDVWCSRIRHRVTPGEGWSSVTRRTCNAVKDRTETACPSGTRCERKLETESKASNDAREWSQCPFWNLWRHKAAKQMHYRPFVRRIQQSIGGFPLQRASNIEHYYSYSHRRHTVIKLSNLDVVGKRRREASDSILRKKYPSTPGKEGGRAYFTSGQHLDISARGKANFKMSHPHDIVIWCMTKSGPRLNIKTVLSTYGDFHVKDKTAVRTSYL